ncbi:MAG: cation-translocating P-type ATPase [Phycisphaerales bacterium]|nr:cation-translocating P-type ATPase [Planctomycetota bacterium]MCH8509738.1 cation-translocating P-type ATPase [Phycisphaerales bacterium]
MADASHSHVHVHEPVNDSGSSSYMHGSQSVQCCSHHDMDVERYLGLYLIGGVLALVSWIAHLTNMTSPLVATLPAVAAAFLLGFWLFKAAVVEVLNKRVSSSSLAALAILAAMAVGNYGTAAFLAFILLVADQVVRRTASGAQRAIEQLVKLTPTEARVVDRDGTERTVPVAEVAVGSTVRVRPGENLPVDGRVLTGQSSVNQASLTGEAMPVEVQKGSDVYAGTTNLTGAVDIEVTAAGADTTIGKVSSLIREAESARTPRQLLIEQVAKFYVPVAISVAAIVFFFNARSPDPLVRDTAALKAVTVLVVTCPTALLLSSPSAMVAAFAAAARLGVMVKRTEFLESAATIDAVVMDKTGTLTTGRFEVSRLAPAEGVDGAELLKAAAAAEARSNHPLAQSIIRTAEQARITVDPGGEYEEIHGAGVKARTSLGELVAGRGNWIRTQFPEAAAQIAAVEARTEGMSGVHVVKDGRYLGAVGLEDKVRPNGKSVVERLRELGVRTVAIFTGDRLSVGKRVGLATGVDMVEAECLPEEKHELIKQLNADGYRVMMVGDGINDGPALAEADVGVAMGLSGSDIAANSAGVALMTDELNRLPFLMELARRTRGIIGQNITISVLSAIIGLSLAASGVLVDVGGASLGVAAAALLHFVPDVLVIANSFRLFRFGEDFLDAETAAREQAEAAARRLRREASVRNLTPEPA